MTPNILLLGVELVSDRESKTPAHDAAEMVLYHALSRGLSFKISLGNVLTLTPPLIITTAEMDAALDILLDILEESIAACESAHGFPVRH